MGSFIFGLLSDRPETFKATADLAVRAGITFAQFVMLTPYPGTVDFERWERKVGGVAATSNVLAGRLFGLPVRGTHAHSWVMAFASEVEAFEAWARA